MSGGRVLDGLRWSPTAADARVFEANVPAGWGALPALHVGGKRATLARFPNANPARHGSAEAFSRLKARRCTAMDRIFIPAYCFAIS